MKQKIYMNDWQCPGCYYLHSSAYLGFKRSKKKDAPWCCGANPMARVNKKKVKIKI